MRRGVEDGLVEQVGLSRCDIRSESRGERRGDDRVHLRGGRVVGQGRIDGGGDGRVCLALGVVIGQVHLGAPDALPRICRCVVFSDHERDKLVLRVLRLRIG